MLAITNAVVHRHLTVPEVVRVLDTRRMPTVYALVLACEERGLIEISGSVATDGRPHRKYRATRKGRRYALLYRAMLRLEAEPK
ncbi:hypothetical protein A3C18_00170 [Candidatus Kaiserbacteria bacterium RIFCSPHIGHO2_02_FULL_54_11b]|uniref:Transcription regulator PadR N-terminal domain-containing protein n=1 Tax=Candidatus Kaiserbacteria bacterium RIFCSPHIGHO2_02_FULL_54_11b TaxID=1798494 RepID=A0A1F6DUK1_9BACT|nr:MAG: hypothetical protein A3C18_00170 [Candidatus Kaiserbacteria bacterium RIFCSPHIGHO2_02_FULL_54_11b]